MFKLLSKLFDNEVNVTPCTSVKSEKENPPAKYRIHKTVYGSGKVEYRPQYYGYSTKPYSYPHKTYYSFSNTIDHNSDHIFNTFDEAKKFLETIKQLEYNASIRFTEVFPIS